MAGHLISRIGSEMQTVAINWHIYNLTGNPLSLGIIGLVRFISIIIFSPLGGITADKFDRRKVMFVSQIFMIFFSLILTVTTYNKSVSPFLIYILIALSSASSAFDTPARQAIIPGLVPAKDFINATSLNTIIWQAAIVIGPAIGGFVIASRGEGFVYLSNTISFIAFLISLILIKIPPRKIEHSVSWGLKSFMEGLNFVFHKPLIYSTMILDFIATFFGTANVLMPIFAKDILAVGPQGLGFLYAAGSLGAVIAGLIVSSIKNLKPQGKILLASISVYGLTTLLFGISRNFYLSLLFLFLAGAGDAVSTIIRNTIRQLATPDTLRGRMISVNMIFFMGGPQLGEAEAGVAASLIGTSASVVLGGFGTIITTLIIASLIPVLRKYKGDELITQ
jgi:MFS family permease